MTDSDSNLLKKFKAILEMSREVKILGVAKYLKLTEDELFEKLLTWKDLGFKIKNELIIVDDLAAFTSALDRQFLDWGQKEQKGIGKILNKVVPLDGKSIEKKETDFTQPVTALKIPDKGKSVLSESLNISESFPPAKSNKEEKKLIYCSECNQVYYAMPRTKLCTTCHNELNSADKISDLDVLTCRTCHTLYSGKNEQEVIPKIENISKNCTCRFKCPSINLFNNENSRNKNEGNIELAFLHECINCGAIYFRNTNERNSKCTECSSTLVHQINYDPEKQKVTYKCANPSHGIRLKLQDIILENNAKIHAQITVIKKKEQELEKLYMQELHEFETSPKKKFMLKNIEKRKKEIDLQAKEKRKNLFLGLEAKALRCVVYKRGKGKTRTKTKDGCNAIAIVKIRKN
jgi:predicted  nucleic acid-binding Zn-ribbon protein